MTLVVKPEILASVSAGLCLFFLVGCGSEVEPGLQKISGETMGTYYRVTVLALPPDLDTEQLTQDIEWRLHNITHLMSTYEPDSEVSRFNDSIDTDWFSVSEETAQVVDAALAIYHQSGGAFDITVGPLVELWGFGSKRNNRQIPADNQIESALRRTGSQHLEVRHDPPSIKKSRPELQIDLSAIAKGYAVDALIKDLTTAGITDCLVDIGGEMRAIGSKGPDSPWTIAIESPASGERSIHRVLPLVNQAIATSGDYRNYFEDNGQRYSHEIDPRTGRPITHRLVSTSVLANDCMTADAWATALMIPGPAESGGLAEKSNLSALLIVNEGEGFIELESPRFASSFSHSIEAP
tara:strand:- start:652 stop:1707 length:1056 start_codon:yes stop_codon:yes gene_type:complete